MDQQELLHEDWRDALRHLVKALGGMDAVGVDLWPGKTRHAAGAWLSDCLNPDRPAKLDLEDLLHLLKLARDRGVHLGVHFLCDELGYQRPAPVEPADAVAETQRQLDELLARAQSITNKLARLRA